MIRYLYMKAIEIVVIDGDMKGCTADRSTFAEHRHHHFVLSPLILHNFSLLSDERRHNPPKLFRLDTPAD